MLKKVSKPRTYRFWLLLIWLTFNISLTIWWFLFGEHQLELITEAGFNSAEDLVRSQRMLFWEGLTLIVSLIAGAVAFFLLARKERKQSEAINRFLLTFTHELKTPIASLRLQAEELMDRLAGSSEQTLLQRLVTDTSRLTLQLDNSLLLASLDSESTLTESVKLSDLINQLREEWPGSEVVSETDANLNVDKRVLLSILRNLVHNSVVHGKTHQVEIVANSSSKDNFIELIFMDLGAGFKGETRELGHLFHRHYSGSGSGIGLFLVRKLTKLLGGESIFPAQDKGFRVILQIPGQVIR